MIFIYYYAELFFNKILVVHFEIIVIISKEQTIVNFSTNIIQIPLK